MSTLRRRIALAWWLAGAAVALLGALAIVRADIAARREAFQTDARVAHRLLSQRAVQHEAILATLTLLQPVVAGADLPEARLPAVYPQLLAVLRRDATLPWPDAALQAAEDRSRRSRHAELAAVDVALGQYTLVQAGTPGSFALRIAVQAMVPWDDWPVHKDGPVQVALVHGTQTLAVQAGAGIDDRPAGLTPGFVFAKTLAAPGQPFELQLRRATGPAQWPWVSLLAWLCGCAATVAGLAAWQRARQARRRAEALLRVDQVARLNAMGELAAGMAHELNQPLAAAMAGAQAARRLLDDDPPELDTARQALGQVVAQGRRAADVVARLRRQVESPTAVAANALTNTTSSMALSILRGVQIPSVNGFFMGSGWRRLSKRPPWRQDALRPPGLRRAALKIHTAPALNDPSDRKACFIHPLAAHRHGTVAPCVACRGLTGLP